MISTQTGRRLDLYGNFTDMTKKHSFWKNFLGYLGASDETVNLVPSQKLRLSGKRTRVPYSGFPVFEIEMGKQRLHMYPDLNVDQHAQQNPYDFILYDPQRYYTGIGHSLRLRPGETLAIDRDIEGGIHLLVTAVPGLILPTFF